MPMSSGIVRGIAVFIWNFAAFLVSLSVYQCLAHLSIHSLHRLEAIFGCESLDLLDLDFYFLGLVWVQLPILEKLTQLQPKRLQLSIVFSYLLQSPPVQVENELSFNVSILIFKCYRR